MPFEVEEISQFWFGGKVIAQPTNSFPFLPKILFYTDFALQYVEGLGMVDITEISTVVASVGVIVGIILAFSELRSLRLQREIELETRQAQLFMGIYQTYVTKELHRDIEVVLNAQFTDFEDWLSKYGPKSNPEMHAKFDSVLSYMEGLGSLVKRGLIDPTYVVELLGLEVLYTHQKYRPIMSGMRKANPTLYTDFDALYETVKKFIPEPRLEDRHRNR